MDDRNLQMARRIAALVAEQGGRVYFVGGLVRDRLLGRENKDVDIEVHGITHETLETILDSLGERTQMGASFGIYGLKHCEVDIAMPRREEATGRGHRDFAVFTDPFLGTEKAAMRRDFTINALMEDVLTGEIVDHFDGKADAAAGILRHVSEATFAEDPLRVLRAAQFAARLGFRVAEETVALCRSMDLSALASERILGEMEKALLKAEKPSVFFETLRRMDQLGCWFGELQNLIGVPQEPRFHPEGDVWNHTMAVVDAAAQLRGHAEEPLAFMLAALCHDLGKPETTRLIDGRLRSFGHEEAGVPIAERLLSRLTREIRVHKYVQNMVQLHMRPNMLAGQNSGMKAYCRLFDSSVSPSDLLLLAKADAMGCAVDRDYSPTEDKLRGMLAQYRELMEKPCVKGSDLVAAGFRPGKDFREALEFAHKLHLAGVARDEALSQTTAWLRKKRES